MISRKRDGTRVETYDGEGKMIGFLYGSGFGRALLKVLVSPWVSKCAGFFLERRMSKALIRRFIQKNHLDLRDYPERTYRSFNDFFTRKIAEGARTFPAEKDLLASPSDGKVTIFPLYTDARFVIKSCEYTLDTLLRDPKLTEKYRGGYGILIRLTVDDYHRYAYPVSGHKGGNIRIPGVYHTVNPRAAQARPIYQENTREYTQIETERFGSVLMMEIGAMLVGRIKNHHQDADVLQGEEKGYFEFGGSSILILVQKDRFLPDRDIMEYSGYGEETVVHMGERLGTLRA